MTKLSKLEILFLAITSLITLGLNVAFYWEVGIHQSNLIFGVFSLVPILIVIVTLRISRLAPSASKVINIIGGIFAFFTLAFYTVIVLFVVLLSQSIDPKYISGLDGYNKFMRQNKAGFVIEQYDFLPKDISAEEKVFLFYQPPFMQGGSTYQLIVGNAQNRITRLKNEYPFSKFEGNKKLYGDFPTSLTLGKDKTVDFEGWQCTRRYPLPSDNPEEQWNQFQVSLICINEPQAEVLYYAIWW